MLSREIEEKVRQHLRLARGLLETAVLVKESSEFDERNALSRAYYAMFHASRAWLLFKFGVDRRMKHGQPRIILKIGCPSDSLVKRS